MHQQMHNFHNISPMLLFIAITTHHTLPDARRLEVQGYPLVVPVRGGAGVVQSPGTRERRDPLLHEKYDSCNYISVRLPAEDFATFCCNVPIQRSVDFQRNTTYMFQSGISIHGWNLSFLKFHHNGCLQTELSEPRSYFDFCIIWK